MTLNSLSHPARAASFYFLFRFLLTGLVGISSNSHANPAHGCCWLPAGGEPGLETEGTACGQVCELLRQPRLTLNRLQTRWFFPARCRLPVRAVACTRRGLGRRSTGPACYHTSRRTRGCHWSSSFPVCAEPVLREPSVICFPNPHVRICSLRERGRGRMFTSCHPRPPHLGQPTASPPGPGWPPPTQLLAVR